MIVAMCGSQISKGAVSGLLFLGAWLPGARKPWLGCRCRGCHTSDLFSLSWLPWHFADSGYSADGDTIYFDSFYGIGVNSRPLRRGYDCPWHATYLPSSECARRQLRRQPGCAELCFAAG